MSDINRRALAAAISREREANRDWSKAAKEYRKRIAELEAENARLREAAEKQRAIINNYSLAPDIHKLLRQLHEQILGVGDE